MRTVTLPYIHQYVDKTGKTRRYVRRNGRKLPLKLQPDDKGYLEEYQAALKRLEPQRFKPEAGTWHALVTEYLGSAQFRQLKPRTQAENRREAERIREKWGKHPVNRLEPRHIMKWRDELSEKPGKANNVLAVLKMLLSFGKLRGYRRDNPADGIGFLKIGSYRSWTDDEITAFATRWPVGTIQRLIFDLALFTGQRRADLLAMTRHHIDKDVIGVVQEKTGTRLAIPLHENLKASIAAFKTKGIALLQKEDGTPFKARELHDVIASAIDDAELPKACVLHGLRYSAARCLADAGATPHEIMAITGHSSLQMVEHYTRQSNKGKLAETALKKLVVWENRNRT